MADDDQSDADSDSYDDVLIGPDLNPGRSALDKKVYRQIILKKNGLRAILISDTLAMGQQHDHGNYDDDSGYESDSSSVEEEGGEGDDDDGGVDSFDEEEDDDEGIRKAAAALVVRAGSFHDPMCCQGLAHFLEHMLFMGTSKFPTENAYDAFLQKNGGSDNAFTELEHTLFHFEISQEKLFDAMDMFAQFFVSPLLLPDAVERELNAIESEYQLSRNADECRLQQLLCHTGKAGADHPFGKFSWGNIQSLKEIPEENNVDVMGELRKFYDQFYYGLNMRLVVIGAFSLDELQEQVVRCFSDVPAQPRELSPLQMKLSNAGTWNETNHSPIGDFGMPFSPSDLGLIYRIVPVKDRHSLSITWQIPPQGQNWKSKPADYIAHLLGHEASGSLLSALKEQSWANACYAGVGQGGYENASSHALFTMTLILSEEGVPHWADVVSYVYKYIGIFSYHCHSPEGLPSWIFDELQAIQRISHKFQDEKVPEELVEEIAEDSLCDLPPDRLLDGNSLLFEFDGEAIQDLLDNYFTPRNARIDLMSSAFGQDSDYNDAMEDDSPPTTTIDPAPISAGVDFSLESAGQPQQEPNFGTRYWCQILAEDVLATWLGLGAPQPAPPSSVLALPPINPFIPTSFELKSTPPEDSDHPLIRCSLKVCVSVGRKKSWFPASVIDHNEHKGEFLLSFEDEDEKWHKLDMCPNEAAASIKPDFEGTFDNKSTKFKIISVPKEGESFAMKYGDESDYHVEDGINFPAIPPPSPDTRLPQMISNNKGLKMWHLQDRKFKRPIAELRMKIVCAGANKSPFHRACADLFVTLCEDAVTETSYLASICELGSSIGVTDVGFTIRIHGFDHKLLDLASEMLRVLFSFRGGEDEQRLPSTIKAGRFEQCLEMLLRNYANAGMQASRFCTDIRLRCLRPTIWSAGAKADSLRGISVSSFRKVISTLFEQVDIEAFYHGNVDVSDAKAAEKLIRTTMAGSSVLPEARFPTQPVIKTPLAAKHHTVVAPTKDANEPNTAVEHYIQVGQDNVTQRVLVDLLAHILYEPLFDQLRTKEQFGYNVSCGARWTYGVIGMSVKVVTSSRSAHEASTRIDDFLLSFREELASMEHSAFLDHLIGLANLKLQMFNSLEEECSHYWNEIIEGRYEWEVYRNEALCLRAITKEQLVAAYDEWLLPRCPAGKVRERRQLVVHVIGTSEGPASVGRPKINPGMLEKQVDECVSSFHKVTGLKIWEK